MRIILQRPEKQYWIDNETNNPKLVETNGDIVIDSSNIIKGEVFCLIDGKNYKLKIYKFMKKFELEEL